jgi:hypothetical protein
VSLEEAKRRFAFDKRIEIEDITEDFYAVKTFTVYEGGSFWVYDIGEL